MVQLVRFILGRKAASRHVRVLVLQRCRQNSIFPVYVSFLCNSAKDIKIDCVVLDLDGVTVGECTFSAAGLAPEKMTANLAGIMQACNSSGFLTARSLATTTAGFGSQRWQLEITIIRWFFSSDLSAQWS